jgi:hypothetical protein
MVRFKKGGEIRPNLRDSALPVPHESVGEGSKENRNLIF